MVDGLGSLLSPNAASYLGRKQAATEFMCSIESNMSADPVQSELGAIRGRIILARWDV